MRELTKALIQLLQAVDTAIKKLNLDADRQKLTELEDSMAAPDFWDNTREATQQSKAHAGLKNRLEAWDSLRQRISDAIELAKLEDHKLEKDLAIQLKQLEREFESLEFELAFVGPYDRNSAILHIHAGTGGTDAQDWAQILERMYLRWSEQNNFGASIISETPGEEAGLKSVIINIEGSLAYGKLKSEHGVHRLVRKSPFNSDNLRQTSFALVEVLPKIDEPREIEIDPKDLKVDVFRSSGKGGQSVNTTDSAVRVTHLPTGISVSIQNERSQLQNRETALGILRSRLAHLQQQQHAAEIAELKGPSLKAEWGQQIRNYIFDPYQLVKDTRTGFSTSDVDKVLDGQLDGFIDAYLARQTRRR